LSILVGYGPTVDLTESRDRVVGVLLGNLIIFLVYTTIWPISALDRARQSLAAALNKLSQMIAIAPVALREEQSKKDALFFAFSDAIFQARRLVSLDPFEPKHIQFEAVKVDIALKDAIQGLCGPVILLGEQSYLMPLSDISNRELTTYCQSLSSWLSHVAEQVKNGTEPMLPLPNSDTLVQSFEQASIESTAPNWLLSCNDWYRTLDERIYQLETLIKKSIKYGNIPLNQVIKEST
jgi:multidrug resistance protein MdtO